jgi:hypothetical protein
MEPRRAYRILGVPDGAPQEDVKRAYLDLAQVWHPDRFEANDRLRVKAQTNLARINEAYQVLKGYNPPAAPPAQSLLSSTFSGLGDLFDSAVNPVPGPPPPPRVGKLPSVVLGLGDLEATWVAERRQRRRHETRRRRTVLAIAMGVAAAVAAAAWWLFLKT